MDLLTPSIDYREYRGNMHFMSQLQREYNFPVFVVKEDEDGSRTLLRIENSGI